jgi:hypothetical protein
MEESKVSIDSHPIFCSFSMQMMQVFLNKLFYLQLEQFLPSSIASDQYFLNVYTCEVTDFLLLMKQNREDLLFVLDDVTIENIWSDKFTVFEEEVRESS